MRRIYRVDGEVIDGRPRTYEAVDMTTGELVIAWAVPHPDEFGGADFLEDERLAELLDEVLEAYPEEFWWLTRFRIRILWKRKVGGKHPIATCQVASGLTGYFSKCDFIILVSAEHVRDLVFTPKQVEAVVYHELLHCDEKGEERKPATRDHDLEVFAGELRHYGAWRRAIETMRLPFRELEAMLSVPAVPETGENE